MPFYASSNDVLSLCMIMAIFALLVGRSQSFASPHFVLSMSSTHASNSQKPSFAIVSTIHTYYQFAIPKYLCCFLCFYMFDDHWRIAARVSILLEKGPSRNHISKIRKFQKNTRKLYFTRRLKKPEGEGERGHRAASPPGGVAQPLAAPPCGESPLAHFCHRPFAYFIIPKNLSQGGSEIDTATSAGRKTPEREKLSGRQKSVREIPSQRGEIIAIIITIAPNFIGIIIIIISITSTFIFTITMPSRYNILSWILLNS
jgi:hypothetical protein